MDEFKVAASMYTFPSIYDAYREDCPKGILLLVASDGIRIILVNSIGPGFHAYQEQISYALGDLEQNIGVPKPGVYIWDGAFNVHRSYDGEYDAELEGEYRPLTKREWESIYEFGIPWDETLWFK